MRDGDLPRFLPCGDAGLTVEFGQAIDPQSHVQVMDLDARLRAEPLVGVIEAIPTYRSLTLLFDPSRLTRQILIAELRARLAPAAAPPVATRQRWRVPVHYGGADGLDLAAVAAATGLAEAEVIALHQAPVYRVYMLGFMPGFPYMGGLDPALSLPRLSAPRARIVAGSVIIAAGQAAVAPVAMPCGWHVLGRTALVLFDPGGEPPALFAPGAEVRFVAVDAATQADFLANPAAARAFAEVAA